MVSQKHNVYDGQKKIGTAEFIKKNGSIIFSQHIEMRGITYAQETTFDNQAAFEHIKKRQGYLLENELGQLDLFKLEEGTEQ